jgi:hypothetical protein
VGERLRRLFVGGSAGNARLTAAVAVVLLVLLAAEGLTLLGGVGSYLFLHMFIGLLLIPVIGLKMASTSWRMVSYYRRVEEYVREGPPQVILRILVAPILVAATIVMFATGIGAALVGHGGLLLGLHKVSFVVWGVAFGLHVLAHVLKLPRLVELDWTQPDRLAGRRLRQYLLAISLVSGVVLAFAAIPLASHWHHGFRFEHFDH